MPHCGWVPLDFSGLLHALVWLVTGESWDGPLSIRKPILFGISTGMTLISLGWVQHRIRPAKYDAIINPLFAIAMLIEVGLISTLYWRGQASHFNHATPLDDTIDQVMTCLILFAAFVIFDLTRRSYSFLWVTAQASDHAALAGSLVDPSRMSQCQVTASNTEVIPTCKT